MRLGRGKSHATYSAMTTSSTLQDFATSDLSEIHTYAPAAAAEAPFPRNSISQTEERSVAGRKLQLLKRSGLFGQDLKGATIERACSLEDLRNAYRLVHDVYVEAGFIHPEPSGMRVRIFETTTETATFVAKYEERVVGVLSVVTDSEDLGLPSDCAFEPELDALRATGARLGEVTNQAVATDFRKSAVPTELMRCAIALSLETGLDETVAAVSPTHNGFYDLLGFRQIGSHRSYSQKLYDPVVALSMEIAPYREPQRRLSAIAQFMYDFLAEENQFLSRVAEWANESRRHFLNPELLQELFVRERNFLAECSPAELEILHTRWGGEIFEAVTRNSSIDQSDFTFETEKLSEFSENRACQKRSEGDLLCPILSGTQ